MLAKVVEKYLSENLSESFDRLNDIGDDKPFIRFRLIFKYFGDIEVYGDGDEITVVYGRFTHAHYSYYEDVLIDEKALQIAKDVFDDLEDTFSGNFIFWGSHSEGGGFKNVINERSNDVILPVGYFRRIICKIFNNSKSREYYTWSGEYIANKSL